MIAGNVHYVDRPGPQGWPAQRALVLVHGLGGRWQHYERIVPDLARHARTIAIDLPGFGASPLPKRAITLDDHADAVAAVLAEAAVSEAVIVGHSLGGPLALHLAHRHPGAARALVLACGTVQSFQRTLARKLDPWIHAPATALTTIAELLVTAIRLPRRLHRPLAESRLGRRLALWPFVHHPADLDPALALALIAGAGTSGVLPTARALGRITGWERRDAAALPPVYAINGAYDRIAPRADLERFPVPLQRATVLPTGHMVMLEAPDRFVEELVEIVSRTWG
jgi:pimeloyl-ACP methyl ester carboxylesterase